MLAEQAIYQLIRDDVDVQAFNPHIYAGRLPQSVEVAGERVQPYPGVAIVCGGRAPEAELVDEACTVFREAFRVYTAAKDTSSASGFSIASDLDIAIFRVLHRYAGTVTDVSVSPVETLEIQGIFVEAGHINAGEDEQKVNHFMSEYVMKYKVPSPNKNS